VPQLDLGPEFRCGHLTVPENRTRPGGRTIEVGVAIAKAASPRPRKEPLVYLTGGPGGTAIVTAAQKVAAGLNADRDVIFVDQRGEYHADPAMTCPDLDRFLDRMPTLPFFDATTRQASQAATTACRAGLTADGADLAAYNTFENAADIADLRVALGIRSWDVYGVSYGTYLALILVREHPEGIRSVVLDSVVPPQENTQEGFWVWPSYGYEHLFAACDAQRACSAAYPNLRQEFFRTVNALEAHPMTVTITAAGGPKRIVLDGYALANALVLPSLAPGVLQDLPRAVHAIANGDGTPIASIVGGDGAVGVQSWGLGLGVFCGEMVAYTTPARSLAAAKRALPTFPESVLTPRVTQAPTLAWDCATWDVPRTVENPHRMVTTDIPTLVLAGTLDAITPPENGRAVLPGLRRSRYVEFPDAGHDVIIWDTECSHRVMHEFLDHPRAPLDTRCVDHLSAPRFTTS
jgi:pimeloyl-ACP methyl ester carboxylesterase